MSQFDEYRHILEQHPEDASIWPECQIVEIKVATGSCEVVLEDPNGNRYCKDIIQDIKRLTYSERVTQGKLQEITAMAPKKIHVHIEYNVCWILENDLVSWLKPFARKYNRKYKYIYRV